MRRGLMKVPCMMRFRIDWQGQRYNLIFNYMKKSELFALILSIISDVTEISENDILSKSFKEDIVEARMLLIYFCHKEGLLPAKIAELSGLSHRCINKHISKANLLIPNGGGYILINSNSIAKQLRSKLEQFVKQ